MIISKVILKNWRNFKNVDVNLQERVFLVGPNAAGKSKFLDVFRFLKDIARSQGGGLQNAIENRGGLSKIRCLAARESPDVEIEIQLKENTDDKKPLWRYSFGIKQTKKDKVPYLTYEKVYYKIKTQTYYRSA